MNTRHATPRHALERGLHNGDNDGSIDGTVRIRFSPSGSLWHQLCLTMLVVRHFWRTFEKWQSMLSV